MISSLKKLQKSIY